MTLLRTGALAALALALAAGAAHADERCYGVAPAGENAGLDGREAPGSSTVDFQGNAWILVPDGTCLTRQVPVEPDGTPRRGSLEPLDLLVRSQGHGWRIIGGDDVRLLEWARTEQVLKRLRARNRKIETEL